MRKNKSVPRTRYVNAVDMYCLFPVSRKNLTLPTLRVISNVG